MANLGAFALGKVRVTLLIRIIMIIKFINHIDIFMLGPYA